VNGHSRIGDTIGDYLVTSVLGSGATSIVYRAVHHAHGQPVAIKVMCSSREAVDPSPRIERFLTEVELLRTLDGCPYVVQLHEWGFVDQRQPYYVMDVIEGETLEQVIQWREPYTSAEAFLLLQQLCIALQAVHTRGVLHLDLKPSNILLREERSPGVVLLDFGIAALLGKGRKTKTLAAGTPLFAAPEQAAIRPERFCTATDVYSLGVLTYMMLSKHEPFDLSESDDALSLFTLRLRRDPVPLSERLPSIEPALAKLVDSCLALEPNERPSAPNIFIERYADAIGVEPSSGLSCDLCRRRPTCVIVPPPRPPLGGDRAPLPTELFNAETIVRPAAIPGALEPAMQAVTPSESIPSLTG
jgi:serine/threonine protein kinase